jgi:hypothetical protein
MLFFRRHPPFAEDTQVHGARQAWVCGYLVLFVVKAPFPLVKTSLHNMGDSKAFFGTLFEKFFENQQCCSAGANIEPDFHVCFRCLPGYVPAPEPCVDGAYVLGCPRAVPAERVNARLRLRYPYGSVI